MLQFALTMCVISDFAFPGKWSSRGLGKCLLRVHGFYRVSFGKRFIKKINLFQTSRRRSGGEAESEIDIKVKLRFLANW